MSSIPLTESENALILDESEISAMSEMLNGRKYIVEVPLDDETDFMTMHHVTRKLVRAAHIVTINGVKFVIEAGKKQEIPEVVYDSLYESEVINPELMPRVEPMIYDAYGNVLNFNRLPD